ncbi:non-ribosomal peptide synthetase, partial [Micromonospora sp. CPCC 205546]
MSVGFVGAPAQATDVAGPGSDLEVLDLMGDLRRPTAWPARAASEFRAVRLPDRAGAQSPGAVVLAGLLGVLARYTGQAEVVVGLSPGGALRVDVADDPGFGELVTRVGAALAGPVALDAAATGPVVVGLVDGPVAEAGPEAVDVDLVVSVASDGSAVRVDHAA